MNSYSKITSHLIRLIVLIGLIGSFSAPSLFAQNMDYGPQVEAFKQSFNEKNVTPVKQYLSEELAFFTYPASATLPILNQVFSNLPALKSIKISDSRQGEASIIYDFSALGERKSKIIFDGEGLITKIELIDNLLEEQQKAQQAMQNSVQEPNPGKMGEKFPAQKVTFASQDGLTVTGNLYEINPEAPVILLSHQANYNNYEYADIAPKLNAMGYNALAIDQRAGGPFAGHDNETFERAQKKGASTNFLDAEQDIAAAVDYLADRYDKKITVWGSSYSSSLALFVASDNKNVNAAIAFSPGDYFEDQKSPLKEVLQKMDKPFFITSSLEESESLSDMVQNTDLSQNQVHFIPDTKGFHGSRVLWQGQEGAEEYWKAVDDFLKKLYSDH